MAQRGIQILIAVIPPDAPGTSLRSVYDPDIPPQLLSYEVGQAVAKIVKKMKKPARAPKVEAPPA